MSSAADAELTARLIADRDPDAFGELVRRHQALVRNMLARMTGDRALADDLAQDAFVHAFERLDQFGGRGSFRSWLCRIAYTRFIDAARRRASEQRGLASLRDMADDDAGGAGPDSGDIIDLERALARLRDAERAAVTLCYACGFSHAEAAEVMRLPVGTVKSHVLRGRQKLEDFMTPGKANNDAER